MDQQLREMQRQFSLGNVTLGELNIAHSRAGLNPIPLPPPQHWTCIGPM